MKKILIVNLGGIGDLILSQPAITALRQKFPDAQIDFLAASKAKDYLVLLPELNTKYYLDIKYRKSLFFRAFNIVKQLLKLRKNKYDIALNMRTIYSRSAARKIKYIFVLLAAKATYGRNTEGWANFFSHSIDETKIGTKHESEYDFETVSLLGAKAERKWDLFVEEDVLIRVKENYLREGQEKKVVVWHVGGMPSRRIPEPLMSAIVDSLFKLSELKVYFLGSDEELGSVKDYNNIVKVSGLSFMELCSFISLADVFVSNDTGPMHIAAVLKKRMISFFGPGDLNRYDPRVINSNAYVFSGSSECSPCEKLVCDKKCCFDAVKAKAVVDQVLSFTLAESKDANE